MIRCKRHFCTKRTLGRAVGPPKGGLRNREMLKATTLAGTPATAPTTYGDGRPSTS